jgi:phosphohistidine phosphatase
MKTLLLMRHGKSSWSDPSLDDFDRPLKKRGVRAARAVGRELRRKAILPDLIVSSAAKRALETAKLTAKSVGYNGEIVPTERLYFSEIREQLAMVAEIRMEHRVLMLFGHNPNMEQLVEELTGEYVTMPTAALVHIELEVESWKDVTRAVGRLVSVILPRELE